MSGWERFEHDWIEDEIRDAAREGRRVVKAIARADLRRAANRALDGVEDMPDLAYWVARWRWPKTTTFRLLKAAETWCEPARLDAWSAYAAARWNGGGTGAERKRNDSGTKKEGSTEETEDPRNDSGTGAERDRNDSGHTRGPKQPRLPPTDLDLGSRARDGHPMPTPDECDRLTGEVDRLAALAAGLHGPWDTPMDRGWLVRLRQRLDSEADAGLLLRFIAEAPDGGEHGNEPSFWRRQRPGALARTPKLSALMDLARRWERGATTPDPRGRDSPSAMPRRRAPPSGRMTIAERLAAEAAAHHADLEP